MTKQEILLLSQLISWNIKVLKARQASTGLCPREELLEQANNLHTLSRVYMEPDICTPEIEARLKGLQILARTYAEFQLLKQF